MTKYHYQLTDEELLSEQPDPVLQNELRKIDRRHKIEIRCSFIVPSLALNANQN